MNRTTAAVGTALTALALASGSAGVAMAFDPAQPAGAPSATVRQATVSTPPGVRYCDRDCDRDRGSSGQRATRQVRVAGHQPMHNSEPWHSRYGTPRHADCDYDHR